MIYGSVCSGIEAAAVAWHPLRWKAAFYAEIDKFPSAVLAHHYPAVPNLGDMTRYKEWPDATLDVLVGGTPCQSFSIAGLRKGMADPRGNLSLTFLGVANRYRPKWLIWENVPGVLSQDEGRAFGSILGGMAELGYHVAYRVLDAQYIRVDGFGRAVPQRRRRVFVVGHSGDWRRSAAVLFEPESLSWNSAPGRKAGEGIAPTISAGPTGGGGLGTDFDLGGGLVAGTLGQRTCDHTSGIKSESDFLVAHSLRAMGHAGSHANAGGQVAIAIQERAVCENAAAGPDGIGVRDDGAAYTIEARAVPQAVQHGWAVRRLTPTECERLQGFPDSYTDIPWRNKNWTPDGPRYKALGNSMAVNVMRWIGTRIEMVENMELSKVQAA